MIRQKHSTIPELGNPDHEPPYSPILYGWPLLQIAAWILLLVNVVAIASLAFQLTR